MFNNAQNYIGTWSAYLMNGVITEFARQCVIQTLNVAPIRYAKTVCVLEVVTAILHVPMIKRVSTNNVEVRHIWL